MAGISSISSLPSVDVLVNSYLAAERKPIEQFEPEKETLNRRISILTDLKTELTKLNDRFTSFTATGAQNTLSEKIAVSSNESLFTVKADADAVAGVYSIKINQLAKNDTAVSDQFDIDGTDLARNLEDREIRFKIGIGSGTPSTFTMSFNDRTLTNETIVERIADEINKAGIDVNATVIKDTPTTLRLTLISREAGASNALELSDTGNAKVLFRLGFIKMNGARHGINNSKGGYVYEDKEDLYAKFSINGINIVGDANQITDVLRGVTVTLRKAQNADDAPETITVSDSSEDILARIRDFIDDYNGVIRFITEKTSINSTTMERGPLADNFTIRNLQINLRALVAGRVSSVQSGNPQTLSEIGININNNGTLAISNEEKLISTIESSSEKVTGLFNSANGIAVRGEGLLKNFISTGGSVDAAKKGATNRLTGIHTATKRIEDRLTIREKTLRQNFSGLQRSLSKLNSQSAMLQRISGYLGGQTGITYSSISGSY